MSTLACSRPERAARSCVSTSSQHRWSSSILRRPRTWPSMRARRSSSFLDSSGVMVLDRLLSAFEVLTSIPHGGILGLPRTVKVQLATTHGKEVIHTMADVREVTDATWDADVLKSDLPVLIDFWAPWCGPCRMVAPIVQELSEEYAGKVNFMKMNTDENPMVPS